MKKTILILLLFLLFLACSEKNDSKILKKKSQGEAKKEIKKKPKKEEKKELKNKQTFKERKKIERKEQNNSEDMKKIVEYALSFKGKIIPESDNWNKYASGFVKMIYWNFGINLTDTEKKKNDEGRWLGGTELIYEYCKEKGEIFKDKIPHAGDIVFFDNTYDVNKDGEFNDKLTSVGLVTETDNDKTVYFLYNGSQGVKLKVMNLNYPDKEYIKNKNITKTINSKMRWLNKKEKEKLGKNSVLASNLFNSYCSLLNKNKLSDLSFLKNLPESKRNDIVKEAKKYEDKDIPKSGRWNAYASGFVKMVFLKNKVDLTACDIKKDENGKWLSTTQIIYNFVKKNGKLHRNLPKPGDIVFFDNTFDKNKDMKVNDGLTAIGLVVDVDKDNTVYFLYKTSKGVKLRMLNLSYPDKKEIKNKNMTKIVNSQMRWLAEKEKKDSNIPVLASELLNSFGSIYK